MESQDQLERVSQRLVESQNSWREEGGVKKSAGESHREPGGVT